MKASFYLVLGFIFSFVNFSEAKSCVLKYQDFGPQVAVYELIGFEWWQWDTHGDSRPRHYPIKVVVYWDEDIADIRHQFPVIKEKEQDFRYLTYEKAIRHLERMIAEEVGDDKLIKRYKKALERLRTEKRQTTVIKP